MSAVHSSGWFDGHIFLSLCELEHFAPVLTFGYSGDPDGRLWFTLDMDDLLTKGVVQSLRSGSVDVVYCDLVWGDGFGLTITPYFVHEDGTLSKAHERTLLVQYSEFKWEPGPDSGPVCIGPRDMKKPVGRSVSDR